MLKMKMPFVEYSDASLIIEMSKCIGRITTEDRNAIGFKNFKKFIFPSLRRESMGRVSHHICRASSVMTETWWTCCGRYSCLILIKEPPLLS